MGTNYYLHSDICKHCNRYDYKHIGKSSIGWKFHFSARSGVYTAEKWFKLMRDPANEVYDEYEEKQDPDELISFIQTKQKDPKLSGHLSECLKSEDPYSRRYAEENLFLDPEGYEFSKSDFS